MKLVSVHVPGVGPTWGCVVEDEVVTIGDVDRNETLLDALAASGGTVAGFSAEIVGRLKRRGKTPKGPGAGGRIREGRRRSRFPCRRQG